MRILHRRPKGVVAGGDRVRHQALGTSASIGQVMARSAPPPFVLCVGLAALDLVTDVDELPPEDGRVAAHSATLAGGGPAATAAVALSRLGTRVSFVGAVGRDPAGALIRGDLVRARVDVTHLQSVAGAASPLSSGIVRSRTGSRTLVAFPGSRPAIRVTRAVEAASRRAAWIHADHAGFGVVRELRRRGVDTLVSVDGGNPIPDLDLSLVDLYAPAAPELLRWTGARSVPDGLRRAVAEGARVAVATEGAGGSSAVTSIAPNVRDLSGQLRGRDLRRGRTWSVRQRAFPIDRSGSTLGAGDVYHGALLAAIVRGRSLASAMAFASAAAALSCRAVDGRSAIPTARDVDRVVARDERGAAPARPGVAGGAP